MPFKILLSKHANHDFEKLPKKLMIQIGEVIDDISEDPFVLDIKKLKTPFEGFRVRSGNYRILFTMVEKTIVIYSIKHRKDAYKM
jgi:mRNA interferase RelE/StbE